MEHIRPHPGFRRLLTLVLSVLLLSVSMNASCGVIDNIEIDDGGSPPQLRINFTIPLQYLNHAPESAGDEIRIQFQNVSSNLFSRESESQEQQTVTARPSTRIPFLDATYEQVGVDRGILTVRFSRRVKYSVQAGADRRHFIVSVLPTTGGQRQSGQADDLSTAITPGQAQTTLPPAAAADETSPPQADTQQLQQRHEEVVIPDIKPTLPSTSDDRIAALMEEARQAVSRDDNSRAIQLYTKVLQYPDNPYRQDALEFLGVAREHRGQLAHAVREYRRYLSLYPEGEGAERVKQRLAGLTTATRKPKPGKSRATQAAMEDRPWEVYGGFSQFYRRDEVSTDDAGSTVTQNALSSDFDITARKRSDNHDLQSRFTGSYMKDFLGDGPGDQNSISSLYFDASGKRLGASLRLGRQSRNTGGVLGRFDGLLLGYKLTDWMTVNAVGGFPVFSTRDGFHTDRYLYGLSTDLGSFANAWDFNLFVIEQRVESVVDRRAVGGEARYFDSIRSLLTFVDYDILYGSLNNFICLGTWTLPDRTTVNASFDYRNSPVLTTTNALQGQSVGSIDDLLDSLTEEQIQELAKDRTGHSITATLGASRPFTEKIQLSGDVTVSDLSGTEASGGVEAVPDTGKEYFYNLQLIGSNLFKTGDTSILGTRYSDTSTAKIYTVSVDSRYPVIRAWRINPRIRLDYRENDNDESTQWTALPSLRMDYRWRKRYRFEVEGGKEWTTRAFTDRSEDSSSYYLSMGYRADF